MWTIAFFCLTVIETGAILPNASCLLAGYLPATTVLHILLIPNDYPLEYIITDAVGTFLAIITMFLLLRMECTGTYWNKIPLYNPVFNTTQPLYYKLKILGLKICIQAKLAVKTDTVKKIQFFWHLYLPFFRDFTWSRGAMEPTRQRHIKWGRIFKYWWQWHQRYHQPAQSSLSLGPGNGQTTSPCSSWGLVLK